MDEYFAKFMDCPSCVKVVKSPTNFRPFLFVYTSLDDTLQISFYYAPRSSSPKILIRRGGVELSAGEWLQCDFHDKGEDMYTRLEVRASENGIDYLHIARESDSGDSIEKQESVTFYQTDGWKHCIWKDDESRIFSKMAMTHYRVIVAIKKSPRKYSPTTKAI